MSLYRRVFFIIAQVVGLNAVGQLESNWWYFGVGGGIEFTSGSPAPAPGGSTSTSEGCSSASDPITGDLLFYTDGANVYDATHAVMPNGSGLFGCSSSSQSALVVPKPGSSTLFYVFTTDCIENACAAGTCYSVVDMSLNGGLGDVTTEKNVLLFAPNAEQLAATKHENCIDYWVMAKENSNDVYRAYLLTSAGLSAPVITTIGLPIDAWGYGQGKFSPDGTKFAIATGWNPIVQLFDFDNLTGLLSNALTVFNTPGEDVYGLSFSGDNSKLYVCQGSGSEDLYQYDLSSGDGPTILASATFIGTHGAYHQLQLSRDFKIYIANSSGGNLSVINNPNLTGAACGFSFESILIAGFGTLGLCNLPDNYFNSVSPCSGMFGFAYETDVSCFGFNDGMAWATAGGGVEPYTYSWSPGGSTNDTISNLIPGTYVVTITDFDGTEVTDTVIITEPDTLVVLAGTSADTVCNGTFVALISSVTGGTEDYSYQWSTDIDDTLSAVVFAPSSSGYFGVVVTDANGCTAIDSVYVTVLTIPVPVASPDTCVCLGSSVDLSATGTPDFLWSTGETTSTITVTPVADTFYVVSHSNAECTATDTVFVCIYPMPIAEIGSDTSVCGQSPLDLTVEVTGGTAGYYYQWSTDVDDTLVSVVLNPPFSGEYFVNVVDANGCDVDDSIYITVIDMPNLISSPDTCICEGSSVLLWAAGAPSFLWNTGQTTSAIIVAPNDDTYYVVIYSDGICSVSDTTFVCVYTAPTVTTMADSTIESGTEVILQTDGWGTFSWSPSTTLSCSTCEDPVAFPNITTTYVVTTASSFGCSSSDSVTISVYYNLTIPNIITHDGDGINEEFMITGLPPDSKLIIFNRWGIAIYRSDDYPNNWFHVVDGVYFYILETIDEQRYHGNIQVVGN